MCERVFIVGVQRCGTTYLYNLLNDHPDIVMAAPVRPEPKVFLDDSLTGDPGAYDERLFPTEPAASVRGEKSTSYLDHDAALRRIIVTFPDARFVVMLRDPVERAVSHFRFSVDSGLERRSIEAALVDDIEGKQPTSYPAISTSPFAYVRRGRYLEQLRMLEGFAARERIQVVLFEELVAGDTAVGEVYRFLGVDATHRPRGQGVRKNASASVVDIPAALRGLLRDYFAPLNADLAHHLGRDLSGWQ